MLSTDDIDINILVKKIRARVIKDFMRRAGITKCVCFSCGNATYYLRMEGVDIVGVGRCEPLIPGQWFSPEEIARTFPGFFNATSGDLPLHLMYEIADELRAALPGWQGGRIKVGSGETLLALKLAFPKAKIIPYRNGTPATEYSIRATLNPLFKAFNIDFAEPKEKKI